MRISRLEKQSVKRDQIWDINQIIDYKKTSADLPRF